MTGDPPPCLPCMQGKHGQHDKHPESRGGSGSDRYGHHNMSGKRNSRPLTVRIDAAVAEQARTFARDQAGKPLYLTLNALVEQALRNEIQRLEQLVASGMDPGRGTVIGNHHRNRPRRIGSSSP